MNDEELAKLISETSSDPGLSEDELYQTPTKRPLSSPERRQNTQNDSPLLGYEGDSYMGTQTNAQNEQTQMQRLLSSLDDESLIELVNGFGVPPEKKRRFGEKVVVVSDNEDDIVRSPSVVMSDYQGSDSDSPEIDSKSMHSANIPIANSIPAVSRLLPTEHEDPLDEDAPEEKFKFGDYGAYFEDKKVNQQQRDSEMKKLYEQALNGGVEFPPIFSNCIIYVNGRTKPDRLELHKKVIIYGGTFLHYLSAKRSVTHIIASNLTSKKRIEFRNYKVVTPDWIVDSIAAGKRLPWHQYALITGDHDQPKLENMIDPKAMHELESGTDLDTIDCKHPEFLKSFFAKSRLHHLSTWKADLRAAFSKKYVEEIEIEPIPKCARVAIFHIDFDCFFATVSALSSKKYDLNKDPLAVAHGTNSSDVASCNYVARKFGVRNGMWVRSARRLCPNLICLPYNFPEYEVKSSTLYECLANSKFFKMILPVSVDEAICISYFPNSIDDDSMRDKCSSIAFDIRAKVETATGGCTVSIGCAESLVLARLALKDAKPNGCSVIIDKSPEGIDKFLSDFHLDDLPGIGRSIIDKIQKQIFPGDQQTITLGKLKAKCSLQLLINKLGSKTGAKINLFLSGRDDEESLKMLHNPRDYFSRKSISVDINYAIRFDNIHEIDTFIDRICVYLTCKIKELDLITAQVVLKVMRRSENAPIEPAKYLGMGECDAFSRGSRLGVPTDEVGIIATEVKSSFRMLACPPKDLRGISIQFSKLEKGSSSRKQRLLPFKGLSRGENNAETTKLPPLTSGMRPDAYTTLPHSFRRDVKAELLKRHMEVPNSPSPRPSTTASPIKEYWSKHKRENTIKQEIPSSLDNDFMSNLPSQIQREIKRDHAIMKKVRNSVLKGVKNKENNTVTSSLKGRSIALEPIKFQALDRPKDIIKLVQHWIDETVSVGPHKDDLNLFDMYIMRLSAVQKTHFILRLARAMSLRIEFHSSGENLESAGLQEWEEYLIKN